MQAISARSNGCRLPIERRRGPLEEIGRPTVVGVEKGNEVRIAYGSKTGISCRCGSLVGSPDENRANRATVLAYPRFNAVGCVIRRTVVNHNDRFRNKRLCPDAVEAPHHESSAIPDGYHNADGEFGQAHWTADIGIANAKARPLTIFKR
jgi:hypothetical protein